MPKLGKALNKYFIETYWSYPDAVFHPHNEFVVEKSDKNQIKIKKFKIRNRVIVGPMCQYSAQNGKPSKWHYNHLNKFAKLVPV